jgi:O-antigen ligase
MVVGLQFFLEGMHRTKAMPFFVISFLAASVALVPLASRLPYTFQRTLAFVPQQVLHLSVDARLEAQGSTDWRVNMWKALLPTIPQHLLLGKGYTITMEDAQSIGQDSAIKSVDAGQQALAISSDYHNGPLSVILPFGIWGVITFGLFLITSNLVIYRNYRYGRPELKMLNTFIFSTYLVSTINFLFLFGGLSNNMATFSAMIGLSIALNGGVSRVPAREMRNIPFSMKLANARRRPQAAFQPRISDSRPI